eukprot:364972-Chlamydomonas_euryale.AAC.7
MEAVPAAAAAAEKRAEKPPANPDSCSSSLARLGRYRPQCDGRGEPILAGLLLRLGTLSACCRHSYGSFCAARVCPSESVKPSHNQFAHTANSLLQVCLRAAAQACPSKGAK